VIINDVPIRKGAVGLGEAFSVGGFRTAYVGKWHAYGSPEGKLERRSEFVPPSERFGFDEYWKGFECSHDYNDSAFYDGADPTLRKWEGYDTVAQTDDICRYLHDHSAQDTSRTSCPFFCALSWGTPHDPYQTAPGEFRALFPSSCPVELRPNVPREVADSSADDLRGYYSHLSAIDSCMGRLLATLHETGLDRNTILVFTSDHGDMLGCQGIKGKHVPWDESIRVPFLVRMPPSVSSSTQPRRLPLLIDAPDIMPSLLGLCGLSIPGTVQGRDWSGVITGRVGLELAEPGDW
jgi:arylsulfatase A-like enzyme